jgi:hypothetical protein
MFAVLIKYVDVEDHTVWRVDGDPFDTLVDAVSWAKERAGEAPNVFAVVEVNRMFQRAVTVVVTEVGVTS